MAISTLSTADAGAQPPDSLQAAYFRGALSDYRAVVAVRIKRDAAKLDAMSGSADSLAISRMRCQIREHEAECRDLDRLIDGIDRRFSALWANQQ